uniref:Uncharacterized protein n=1 Tax=Tanacetum cinerariifolium TaxID=118510 RepID=A0A699HD71_TANCI|nr:hypothetical protein [Tanacetum cinerariifolium]
MALAISTNKAKDVPTERACQQALWMKQAIKDYDTHCEDILVLCDNKANNTFKGKSPPWNKESNDLGGARTMYRHTFSGAIAVTVIVPVSDQGHHCVCNTVTVTVHVTVIGTDDGDAGG